MIWLEKVKDKPKKKMVKYSEEQYMFYFFTCMLGLFLLMCSIFIGGFGLLFVIVGCFLTVFSSFRFIYLTSRDLKVKKYLEKEVFIKFRSNRSGAAWLIAAGIATIIVAPLLWFMCMYPTQIVIDWVQANTTFATNQVQAINFGLWFLDIMVAFVVFGVIFAVLVNSNWRDTQYNQ